MIVTPHVEEILRRGNPLRAVSTFGSDCLSLPALLTPSAVYAKKDPLKQHVWDGGEPMSHRYTRLASFMLIESPYLSICDGPSWQSNLHPAGTHMRSGCATVAYRVPNHRTLTRIQLRTPKTVDSLCTLEQSYPPLPEIPSPEKGASEGAGVQDSQVRSS